MTDCLQLDSFVCVYVFADGLFVDKKGRQINNTLFGEYISEIGKGS